MIFVAIYLSTKRFQTTVGVSFKGIEIGDAHKRNTRRWHEAYHSMAILFVLTVCSFVELYAEHYKDLASKPFFPKLMGYMCSGPVVAMVWEGKNVVKTGE